MGGGGKDREKQKRIKSRGRDGKDRRMVSTELGRPEASPVF